VGDRNEYFSFASFFPEPLQPGITIVSNIAFNILKLCHCCRDNYSPTDSSTDMSDSATERRRARALRALDERMQQMKQSSQTDIRSSLDNAELPV